MLGNAGGLYSFTISERYCQTLLNIHKCTYRRNSSQRYKFRTILSIAIPTFFHQATSYLYSFTRHVVTLNLLTNNTYFKCMLEKSDFYIHVTGNSGIPKTAENTFFSAVLNFVVLMNPISFNAVLCGQPDIQKAVNTMS